MSLDVVEAKRMGTAGPMLYTSVGEVLTRYELDVDTATLTQKESISFLDTVQYACPHPSGKFLYVISSYRAPVGASGTGHHLTTLAVAHDGRLEQVGQPRALPWRPLHLSVDASGRFALVAYNDPSTVTVHRILAEGAVGAEVDQDERLDFGSFAHQVLVAPSNRAVIVAARGYNSTPLKAEVPGSLRVFAFDEGRLAAKAVVAPNGGFGFGPRHLDFHPNHRWAYVSLERQSTLQLFELSKDGSLSASPSSSTCYLADPANEQPRQLGGTVHVHPTGRFVYAVNRADNRKEIEGKLVFAGGENTLVTFAIDSQTGEPTIIQRIATRTMHVRTFAISPCGSLLIAAGILPMWVKTGADLEFVPAALSIFRIRQDDGRLDFVRRYDVDAGVKPQWWMGVMTPCRPQ
ncbi:6-phosphogluconolactonase [soil metagenome]